MNFSYKAGNAQSKNILKNLKSNYILSKVIHTLSKNKLLDLIKYNKKIQKRININIKDYQEYSEIYSSIEIEIIPVINKYGRFININKEEKKYYHIYFDDNKKETKRVCFNQSEQIKKIKIIIDYQVKLIEYLFYACDCIESINFKKFSRNNITNMGCMFYRCLSLKELNLSKFNTINVTNMDSMFYGCSSLKEINLSKFNTNNLTNMNNMFRECSSLKKIDLSNFNTNNVTNMSHMFSGCSSLEELNLSNFNSNNGINMYCMFHGCSNELKKKIKAQYKKIKRNAFY